MELFLTLASFTVVIFIIIAVNTYYYLNRYRRHPTFDEYKETHPNSIRKGRVTCHSCGGNHIQFRGLWSATDRRKTHMCVSCGTPLYRSYH